MNCVYGPYQITTDLPLVDQFSFVDDNLPRRIAVFVECDSAVTLPCPGAVALHIEDGCPDLCKTIWYECPSENGRKYTLVPTPCGVTITSFEDGLVQLDNCDATQFGTEHFCFGKIYTNVGEFESSDDSATTFEFDGHTFTVTGEVGDCNELFVCDECGITEEVTLFEDIPDAPPEISTPDIEEEDAPTIEDVPPTDVIPSESRTTWTWTSTTTTFGADTVCLPEKAVASWAYGSAPDACESHNNPSITTLPSGHTIAAFENRIEDGTTTIALAILASSVGENVRYHRKLGTGTLLNTVGDTGATATFEVYDEMAIPADNDGVPTVGTKIGFLNGPLAGQLITVDTVTRSVSSENVVKHTFAFTLVKAMEFPDKNHAYDVEWFLVDSQGSSDLPSSENISTVIEFPHYDDEGTQVPVANPSIAVAQNNLMTAPEQNAYVAYQTFENNEWRVYLREIVFGSETASTPIYLSPYLFDENVRQIETMKSAEIVPMAAGEVFYDTQFSGPGLRGESIDHFAGWKSLTDTNIPTWYFEYNINSIGTYITDPLIACEVPAGLEFSSCGSIHNPCALVFNSGTCSGVGDKLAGHGHKRSFAINERRTTVPENISKEALNLTFTMRFVIARLESRDDDGDFWEYPEIWFLPGVDSLVDDYTFGTEGYRIQIRRGTILAYDSQAGNSEAPWSFSCTNSSGFSNMSCDNRRECFQTALYGPTYQLDGSEPVNDDWTAAASSDGSQNDKILRLIGQCIDEGDVDYTYDEWNTLRVETYVDGPWRHFDVFLSNSTGERQLANFREWDPTHPNIITHTQHDGKRHFGRYHGFGAVTSDGTRNQVFFESFKCEQRQNEADKVGQLIFLEDYFDVNWNVDGHPGRELDRWSPFYTIPDDPGGQPIDYTDMVFCKGVASHRGDRYYRDWDDPLPEYNLASIFSCYPTIAQLEEGKWSIFDINIPTLTYGLDSPNDDTGFYNDYSLALGVSRWASGFSHAWPEIWFCLRKTQGSPWYSSWRVRIRYFIALRDYPGFEGGGHPAVTEGDRVWWIRLYDGRLDTGQYGDRAANNLVIVNSDIEWIEHRPYGDIGEEHWFSSVWNYFKVDIEDVEEDTVITVWVGDDAAGQSTIESSYQQLCQFTNPRIQRGGNFSSIAITTSQDPEFDWLIAGDYRSGAMVNYIKLSTIGVPPAPTTGACCRAIGGCVDGVTIDECPSGDGDIFYPNTVCENDDSGLPVVDCTIDIPVGAVCTDLGTCIDNITEAEAERQGLGDCDHADCSWQAGKTCDPGDGDNYRNCPEGTLLGSCCRAYRVGGLPDCVDDVTLAQCQTYYGNTTVPPGAFRLAEDCPPVGVDCPSPDLGACCLPSGCSITTQSECVGQGGDFYLHEDCVSHTCPTVGACCDDVGVCTQETETDCEAGGRTFLGIGLSCTPDPCPDPLGACCYDDGVCTDTTEAGCIGGTWLYASSCSDDPCPITTGCCCDLFTAECTDGMTEEDCLALPGHRYEGDGTICAYIEDPILTGACCVGQTCVDELTLAACEAQGGQYQGNFTNCIPDLCTGVTEDPYRATEVMYKPEDLWIIETAPDQFATRVLYHMKEEITVTTVQTTPGGGAVATADFMFLIDHSNSMRVYIHAVRDAVSILAADMVAKGLDVRFGFVIMARGIWQPPVPVDFHFCDCTDGTDSYIFNALQTTQSCVGSTVPLDGADGGFTRDVGYLQQALDCWGISTGWTQPYAAIQFAVEDAAFEWRGNASKFVFFVSDVADECPGDSCGTYANNRAAALSAMRNNQVQFIAAVSSAHDELWGGLSTATGWTGEVYDIQSENYGEIFESVVRSIDTTLRIDNATVIERAESGTDNTFLKKAEVLITYDGDLSDLWTFNKTDFEFTSSAVPISGTTTKGLTNLPFALAPGRIYGIEPVHILGNQSRWVSFNQEGPLLYDHPNVGQRASGASDNPLLISTNSARPTVKVNNRNDVLVAYENYTTGVPQIDIRGTGDFHQNSIVGPKAERIVRLLESSDFTFSHNVTLPTEGVNQLCDMVIDNSDITHIVWQSSRDGYREIYYANSSNLFEPVRITKSESISSNPSISVDEEGSIFVVYHDNRFGPFNVMLASKDEERVMPLLEQDAYLASLREGYTHYTNILPVLINNPATETPQLGQFWASKLDTGAGNDSENYVYKLDESTGLPSDGEDQDSAHRDFLAFSSTGLYSIDSNGTLSKLAHIGEESAVVFESSPINIGTINLDIDDYVDHAVVDMAVDEFDRIWVLIYERESTTDPIFATTPSGLPLVTTFTADRRLRLEYVSSFDASTVATGEILVGSVDSANGASLAITSDGFYVTWDTGSSFDLTESAYPIVSEGVAQFSFSNIGSMSALASDPPGSMTADVGGALWVVTTNNDLYTVNKLNADATFRVSLTTGSGNEPALPVGATSGIAYQDLDLEATGGSQFFHVRIDFYNNLALEGSPYLSIDSRENLEAFINQETLDDPYLDPYLPTGMDARGIYLQPGEIGVIFFDATHYVPGYSRLSQPYSFEPNQTYFPRVFAIDENENSREITSLTSNTFSCSKCSRFGNNNFNSSACSYSFVISNNDSIVQYYNFQIDFYADTTKQHIIRRFNATPGSSDLQYMEVDNVAATEVWGELGLPISGGDTAFIQIHPALDPTAGFLCGVNYTVQVNECHDGSSECSDFSVVSSQNWFSMLVGDGSETIHEDLVGDEIIAGLSMEIVNNQLSVAWKDENEDLRFAQLKDNGEWSVQVVDPFDRTMYCSLKEIGGFPTISYIKEKENGHGLAKVISFDAGSWNDWSVFNEVQRDGAQPPRDILGFNQEPLVAGVNRGEIGQSSFMLADGHGRIIETEAGCYPPWAILASGSCMVTLAEVNQNPAIAYIAASRLYYREWSDSSRLFVSKQMITPQNVVRGNVGLVEVDGQPAVAYLRAFDGASQTTGDNAQLKYARWNGTEWAHTNTRAPITSYNKHVAIATINGFPHIVYSTRISSTTSQLRYSYFDGSRFIDSVIDDEITVINPLVDIVEYQGEPAVTLSSNPFRIYFFRQKPSLSIEEITPTYFCECASKIFTNRLTHLNEVARWEASAHGFSDTLVTESPEDSILPVIQTRTTGATVILWQDSNVTDNCTEPPCIRAATFRNTNQDQLRGSGTQSWFDYDFGISGQTPDLALDIYDRVNSIYEKPKEPATGTGFHGQGLSSDELPGSDLYGKVCDFAISEGIGAGGQEPEVECDISALEANVITYDPFISAQIVRKIRVKDEFVEYYTYNASENLTPIVSTCNIVLEIHGTPEIVALRFRNENTLIWDSWCPWSPQIGDFVMEKRHQITSQSGIKEICIQAITYSGITSQFCIPVIADYETVVFESRFYRDTDVSGNVISNFDAFPAGLDERLVSLPLSDGISVASILPQGGQTECNTSSDCADDEVCVGGRCVTKTTTILVEIVPSKDFDEETINFDVIQQGANDLRGLVATKGTNNEGTVVYRGDFTIQREDNVSNVDGLARISPAFPSSCDEAVGVGQAADTYTRDIFNKVAIDLEVEDSEIVDPLEDYRQTTSGRVGVTLDIRSLEDPYFVFGDPNYSLKKEEGRRTGVPFIPAEVEVLTGTAPEEPDACEERRTDEECQQITGNETSVWVDFPGCYCSDPEV